MRPRPDNNYAAALASVLSSPLRLAIVELLLKDPCLVGELTQELEVEQAIISKQIGILRSAGLLSCLPEGRCRTYSIADPGSIAPLIAALHTAAGKATEHATHCKQNKVHG